MSYAHRPGITLTFDLLSRSGKNRRSVVDNHRNRRALGHVRCASASQNEGAALVQTRERANILSVYLNVEERSVWDVDLVAVSFEATEGVLHFVVGVSDWGHAVVGPTAQNDLPVECTPAGR